jgi:hypothetical protein
VCELNPGGETLDHHPGAYDHKQKTYDEDARLEGFRLRCVIMQRGGYGATSEDRKEKREYPPPPFWAIHAKDRWRILHFGVEL